MKLSFLDSVLGCQKETVLRMDALCTVCNGNGVDLSSGYSKCPSCRGSGYAIRNLGGIMTVRAICGDCNGQGQIINKHCSHCKGQGRISKNITVKSKIPAGVQEGQVIRQTVAGCEVLFNISITPSVDKWREGKNIHSRVFLTYPQAFLGSSIDIDGIHGRFKLEVIFAY